MTKVVRSIFVLALVAMLLSTFGFAQAEKLNTHANPAATVGRGEMLTEKLDGGMHNPVLLEWRHCQKYVQADGTADAVACANDPSTLFKSELTHNLRTNAGATVQAKQMSDTASQPPACNYIAVTNDSAAAASTDTSLASEIATNGLSRAQGTPNFGSPSSGALTYTVQKVFSASGTQASQKAGLFNASSGPSLCFEAVYTPVTVNNLDTLTVTWTISI